MLQRICAPLVLAALVGGLVVPAAGVTSPEQTATLRPLVGASFPARVVSVIDGDTLDVRRPGHRDLVRVRLHAVDSPESGEPFSNVARARTRVLAFDRDVTVDGRDVDRYDRLVARVSVDTTGPEGPIDVGLTLVAEGLACHYRQYSSDPALARAEADARARGRGFWARDAPKPACASENTPAAPRGLVAPPAGVPPPSSVPPPSGVPAPRPAPGTVPVTSGFVGNVRSRVFHAPTCPNATCPNCTVKFATRAEAERAGYRPSGDCLRSRN